MTEGNCPPGTEYVRGYRKRNGEYVHGHCRAKRDMKRNEEEQLGALYGKDASIIRNEHGGWNYAVWEDEDDMDEMAPYAEGSAATFEEAKRKVGEITKKMRGID